MNEIPPWSPKSTSAESSSLKNYERQELKVKEKGFTYFEDTLINERQLEDFGDVSEGINILCLGQGSMHSFSREKSVGYKLYFLSDPERIETQRYEGSSLLDLQGIAADLKAEKWEAKYGHDIIHGNEEEGYLRTWILILFRQKPHPETG